MTAARSASGCTPTSRSRPHSPIAARTSTTSTTGFTATRRRCWNARRVGRKEEAEQLAKAPEFAEIKKNLRRALTLTAA
jgi:hypothetical protein